ncbi:MAG: hypothetical protein OXB95_13500 [Rhodobacteraceae bacterium]|nr:hypothetical protein [Paracoccaceae bacterium]
MIKNPIVEFLASYGPQASSNSLYDEFVVDTARRTGCQQLEIHQPLIGELKALFETKPVSVILTGTAGDGKTYTARKLLEAMSGSKDKGWSNTDQRHSLDLPGDAGGKLWFIKDLSEFNERDKDEHFEAIRDSLLGRSNDVYLICVNDGHLLKFFRDRQDRDEGLGLRISQLLQTGCREDAKGGFQLINMSHQAHLEVVDRILEEFEDHPDWRKCAGCPANSQDEHRCPILRNLDVMTMKGEATMRARLKDMVSMAAADGRHISIRQIILLMVNILLGDRKYRGRLLNCSTAQWRAKVKDFESSNPYSNVFGTNLGQTQRQQYWVFEVLGQFGVGSETNNHFDENLLRNDPTLPRCSTFGDRLFRGARKQYREDTSTFGPSFRDKMVDQRRRLFFSIEPEVDTNRPFASPWNLTRFRHGATYIQLTDTLERNRSLPARIRRPLMRGLNRMMTGQLTKTNDRLWLTEPSGVFRGQGLPLLVAKLDSHFPPSFKLAAGGAGGKPPILRIEPGPVDLSLNPTMVECLLRVAEGALPASFSSECLQAITRFQLQASAALRAKLPPAAVQSIRIAELNEGELTDRPIELVECEEEES